MADKYPAVTALNAYKEELAYQLNNVLTGESIDAELEKAQTAAGAYMPTVVRDLIQYATAVTAPKKDSKEDMKTVLDMCNDALRTQQALKLHQMSAEDLLFGFDSLGNERE